MSSLKAVVDQLQIQNNSMGDVRDGINSLLKIQLAEKQKKERSELDQLESERKKKEKATRVAAAKDAPKTFKGGLLAGLDIFNILGGLKGVLSSMLGVAGGLALGPLLGKFIGRFLVAGLGMYLGEAYLTDFMDMLIPDVVGKMKFDTIFGEKSVEEMAGALGGVIAILFGPTLIKAGLKTLWGTAKSPTAKASTAVAGMLRKANPLRLLGTSGSAMGTMIKGLLGVEALKTAFKKTAQWAVFALRWGMKGPLSIPLMLIGAALGLTYLYAEYMEKRREKNEEYLKKQLADMDKELDLALEKGDIDGAKKIVQRQEAIAGETTTHTEPYLEPHIIARMSKNLDAIEAKGGDVTEERKTLEAKASNTMGIEEFVIEAKRLYQMMYDRGAVDIPWDQLSVRDQLGHIGAAANKSSTRKFSMNNEGYYDLSAVLSQWEQQETARRANANTGSLIKNNANIGTQEALGGALNNKPNNAYTIINEGDTTVVQGGEKGGGVFTGPKLIDLKSIDEQGFRNGIIGNGFMVPQLVDGMFK
tara:strand:+ start:14517 stop:16112 length:1596 start_codon:yes stop_codon:yes gene_type:complete